MASAEASPAHRDAQTAHAEREVADLGKVQVTALTQTEKGFTSAAGEKVAIPAAPENPAGAAAPAPEPSPILHGLKLYAVFSSLMIALLTIALDQTILSTALPAIGSDFNSFDKQGWITSVFLLTQAAFLIPFGALCRIHAAKYVLIVSLVIFEVGSIVCAASPNVIALIFGRAVAGIGAAGEFSSMITIIAQISSLQDRAALMSLFGAVFGFSSIIGPLIGAGFTQHVTWRWCFWINLPIGFGSIVPVYLLLQASKPLGWQGPDRSFRTLVMRTLKLDWFGGLLFFGATVMLSLALNWADTEKPWRSAAVVCCLVFSIVTYAVFLGWEYWLGNAKALVPPVIWKSVSIYAICVSCFFVRFGLLIGTYSLPTYYQASRGYSPVKSAVNILPFLIISIFTIVLIGQIITRYYHRYWTFLIAGPFFATLGGGLLILLKNDTPNSQVVGFQIILGVGVGFALQNSNLAMQAEFRTTPHLVAQASALALTFQQLGGTISLALGQAVLSSQLNKFLPEYAPNVDVSTIKADPLAIFSLPPDQIENATYAYSKALDFVFLLIPVASGIALVVSFFIENIRLGPPPAPKPGATAPAMPPAALERGENSQTGKVAGSTDNKVAAGEDKPVTTEKTL